MRFSQAPPTLLSLLFVVLSHSNPASAGPFPKDSLHDLGFSFLMNRGCNSYCGADNQYCCTAGQACYTNAANVAYCGTTTAADSGWAVYTTTYTETDLILRTSTYSSYWAGGATSTAAAGGSTATCVPDTSLGETGCGSICCTNSQTCAYWGKCQDVAVTTSWSYAASTTTATGSEAIRPTSGTSTTTTNTVKVTTTAPFGTPASATSTATGLAVTTTSHSLSGGAIAGIVIGVIAGIILLLLFCFCCVLKAGFDGLLAIFGLGPSKRRRSETRVTEERYSRHGSGTASRRATHTGWFGGGSRPARVVETRKQKKSSGLGGLGAVGAGLVGLAVILGLKRKNDKKEKSTVVSDLSSSYYTDSYTGTSASK